MSVDPLAISQNLVGETMAAKCTTIYVCVAALIPVTSLISVFPNLGVGTPARGRNDDYPRAPSHQIHSVQAAT